MKAQDLMAGCLLLVLSAAMPARSQTARQVSDLNPGAVGSYPSNFMTFAGKVYLSAYTQATGFELFRYDGTNVTLAADINDTVDDIGFGVLEGNDSVPSYLTELNGTLMLSAFEPRRGAELWKYDGAAATRVSDINQDANDAIKVLPKSSWPQELVALGNTLYFSATSRTNPPDYELWQYADGIVSQAANIRADTGMEYGSYPQELTVFDGAVFFRADDGVNGWELYRHDAASTTRMDLNPSGGESSSYPKYFTVFGTNLYFQAYTAEAGFELWKTDGRTATMVADLSAGAESSSPQGMTVYNDALYFSATDGTSGYELWRYDGENLLLAADVNSGGSGYPKELQVFEGHLFFTADDGVHGWELWRYDGTNATLAADLNASGDAFPSELTVHQNALYFTATTPETGYEVFKYDASAVTAAADVNAGQGDSFPRSLHSFGNQLIFTAAMDGTSNWELWTIATETTANLNPTVTLSSPATGATFSTSDSVTLTAEASDDGTISEVEFYADGTLIGIDAVAPYSMSTNLAAGSHTLIARARDEVGLVGESAAVTVTVTQANTTPPSVTGVEVSAAGIQLEVTASAGATVILEGSSDLANWSPVETKISTGETVTFTEPVDGTLGFFRVRVE